MTAALTVPGSELPNAQLAQRLGKKRSWSRDLATIGGISSLAAPLAVAPTLVGTAYPWVAAAVGALTGAALGVIVPSVLLRLRKVPLPMLVLLGPTLGILWGGAVGLAAGLTLGAEIIWLSAVVAGVAGAIQFGWFWLPYTARRLRSKRTWPVVVAASLLAPALGWAAIVTLGISRIF